MTFIIKEHLGVNWTDELVGFDIDKTGVGIADEDGNFLPYQHSNRKIYFKVDRLEPFSERRFILADEKCFPDAVKIKRENGVVILNNGIVSVKLPDSQDFPEKCPAPLLGIKYEDGPWMGQGRMQLSGHLQPERLCSRQIESGPLWLLWRLEYKCVGGQSYRVDIKLFADCDYAEITETSELTRASSWEFSAIDGLQPDHSWTHPMQLKDDREKRLWKLADLRHSGKKYLGSIQLPVFALIHIPDDYYYFSFLNLEQNRSLSIIGVNGGIWDYPYENQIDVNISGEDAWYKASIKAGKRRWLLMAGEASSITAYTPLYDKPVHRAVKKYETPLDKVKDYVLEWDELDNACRPFAFADSEQLARARGKVEEYKPFKDYVASLNPDLPGDFTYYSSATHRTFEPDYCNDPAVLYVTAKSDGEREKQAEFLKQVVISGLKDRLDLMIEKNGHTGSGPINMGRGIRPWSALYDFAAAEGVFTPEEERWVKAVFAFFNYKIFDPDYWPSDALLLRDDHPRSAHRTHWFPGRHSDWSFYNIDNIPHNFHSDLWTAAGCVAAIFPGHPESRGWLERTMEFWESELSQWVFPEGAWLESMTYTFASMKDYIIYCRALSNAKIKNYFSDERFQRIFRYAATILLPHDERIGMASFPVMGDSSYPNLFCYIMGWIAGLSSETPEFSAMVQSAWKYTGEFLVEPGRFGLNFFDFLFIEPNAPVCDMPAPGSQWFKGMGLFLRYKSRTPEEIYLFIKSGIIYSHFHEPEGSFFLWWNGVPLCDEYGVQYGKGAREPRQHNCIEILGEGQNFDYNKGDVSKFVSTDNFDYAVIEAPLVKGYVGENEDQWGFKGEMGPAGWHRRHLFFVKPHYVYFYDELECVFPTAYHLNVKAENYTAENNLIKYKGSLGVDLDFIALDLEDREITHSEFDIWPDNPRKKRQASMLTKQFFKQLQLHISSEPQRDYATVLLPHPPEMPVDLSSDPETGGAMVVKESLTEHAMLFPEIRSIDGDIIYHGKAGSVREAGGVLTLLQAEGSIIGKRGVLEIDGLGPFTARFENAVLRIEVEGGARWLVISGPDFSSAKLDGNAVDYEKIDDGVVRVYAPADCMVLELS